MKAGCSDLLETSTRVKCFSKYLATDEALEKELDTKSNFLFFPLSKVSKH